MTADNQSRVEPGTGPVTGVNCPARGSVTGRRRSWRGWAAAILSPDERPGRLTLPAPRNGLQLVHEAAAELRRAQIGVSDIGLRRPTLDDVFLQLTGAPPSQDGGGTSPPSRTRRRPRPQPPPPDVPAPCATSFRQPDLLVFSTIQPVLFVLLFVYVFGGAIGRSLPHGVAYADFLLPGIFVQSVTFGASQTAVGLKEDLLPAAQWYAMTNLVRGSADERKIR